MDLRYERLYACLQDDVTRKWPSVDLVLNLLCPSLEAKLERRRHFAPAAPLLRHGLLHLITDPHQLQPPLLGHYLKLDEQVVRWLLGQQGLDARLAPFCQWLEPAGSLGDLPLNSEIKHALLALVRLARETHQPLRLYFCGPPGVGKRRIAVALAGDLGAPLLAADLECALGGEAECERLLRLLFHAARFGAAIVYLDGLDAWRAPDHTPQFQRVLEALTEYAGVVIGAGTQPWVASGPDSLGVMPVPFSLPAFPLRRACWQTELEAAGMALTGNALDTLASRFRLTPRQVAQAVRAAHNCARWRTAAQSPPLPY